jgi:hypothetical protein
MKSKQSFRLIYDTEVVSHLSSIERKYHSLIRQTIEEQLRHNPDVETRNRKPLIRMSTFDASWELRFGPNNRFRVFYRIFQEEREVYILAIGIKKGNQLFIGGEKYEL